MKIRTIFLYSILFILSYLPQMLSKMDPFHDIIENADPILIFQSSLSVIFSFIIILFVLLSLYTFFMITRNKEEKKYEILFFVSLFFIAWFYLMNEFFGSGSIKIEFMPQLIPVLLSSMIGIIGSFMLSCLLASECNTRRRFQRQNIFHRIYNN